MSFQPRFQGSLLPVPTEWVWWREPGNEVDVILLFTPTPTRWGHERPPVVGLWRGDRWHFRLQSTLSQRTPLQDGQLVKTDTYSCYPRPFFNPFSWLSVRRTHSAGPRRVHLRESWLYAFSYFDIFLLGEGMVVRKRIHQFLVIFRGWLKSTTESTTNYSTTFLDGWTDKNLSQLQRLALHSLKLHFVEWTVLNSKHL